MIGVRRPPEAEVCPELHSVRATELDRVREALRNGRKLSQELMGTEYKVARDALANAQHLKCCYCEERQQDVRWEHVEHFRPKAEAFRETRSSPEAGYWWLTWTWDNLLFACIRCNAAKGSWFPLLPGSKALEPEEVAPGAECPILIDPAAENEDPREHIQFRPFGEHWIPRPRTPRGATMLRAVGLDWETKDAGHRVGLQQEWDDHARRLRPIVDTVQRAIESNDAGRIRAAWAKTKPFRVAAQRFVALALDVLDHHVPEHVRRRWGLDLTVLRP
ncbi:HNH endonuclease [Paraliomyxa miuraensis]|uniref:HNH endonuclease n=1 Tax=Paraliomyxa miuraensis TaxID=376150 RepID=UPI00224CE014|nr:hypothetical protein [Paraliomyxa miuraensis]MCX4239205.1 hypothetical protein [Paraliomyxa miuraensis]